MAESGLATDADELFRRIVTGYAAALDGSGVRAWFEGTTSWMDADGAWCAGTRIAPALAAWAAAGDRPTQVSAQGRAADVGGLLHLLFQRGPAPGERGWWGAPGSGPVDQRTVESSAVAYAAWLARDSVLPEVTPAAVAHLQDWLSHYASGPLLGNNWALFWVVNHAARKALGWPFEQSVIDDGLDIIDGLHRGDGWMTDGGEGRFDDYNWWVFGSHELMWVQMDGANDPVRRDRIVERVAARLASYPWFFGADGSYPEFGRSLAYTFARLAAPVLAYSLGCWPHSTELLHMIVRRHLRWAGTLGNVDRSTGVVRQRLTAGGTPDVRESYIDTGHPYWSTMVFAALWQVDPSDPLWSASGGNGRLPVEQGDFVRPLPVPGWVLAGTTASGQVLRYSLAAVAGGPKYAKFCYGTHAPADLGLAGGDPGPDAALCVSDATGEWTHCGGYRDAVIADDGQWLRAHHTLALGTRELACETVLLVLGETWVTVHRIELPASGPAVRFVQGATAFGYEPGTSPIRSVSADRDVSVARLDVASSTIAVVSGWDRAVFPSAFRGDDHRNARHFSSVTPTVEAVREADGTTVLLAAVARTTRHAADEPFPPAVQVHWADDGTVDLAVTVAGTTTQVLLSGSGR